MTDVGFTTSLDVDLSLVSDDEPECVVHPGTQAVMEGVINAPCGCRQLLCLPCYDRNEPCWQVGDPCWCYPCYGSARTDNCGYFEEWVKV